MDAQDKMRFRLAELREKQNRQLDALHTRDEVRANRLAAIADQDKYALRDPRHIQRLEEIQYRDQLAKANAISNYANNVDWELLRHELREQEREPDFEDFRKRIKLQYLIRRKELADQNRLDIHTLERRITELRAAASIEVYQTVLLALIEHYQSKNAHERLLEEIDARAEAEILKEAHTMRRDNNTSRLHVEEMFEQRFLDLAFSRLARESNGISRAELETLVREWEAEADQLKR